nr:ABC transporter ATP-binding protein [Desulfobulbaceae bacterium]
MDTGDKVAVRDISLHIPPGKTVALVGESGSGKSVTALSILRLLESVSNIEQSGEVLFNNQNLLQLNASEIRQVRGNEIAMIFQEPMTSLNPVYSIGSQIIEPFIIHQNLSPNEARQKSIQLLNKCGILDPHLKIDQYPHQLSGGQRQRVMIAMALACRPSLLIADEPTTALDVTVQAQILTMIKELQSELEMSVFLITHDLHMVQSFADYVYIMNDGQIVESGKTNEIFSNPADPYTKHLLGSIPQGQPENIPSVNDLIKVHDITVRFTSSSGFLGRHKTFFEAVKNVSLAIPRGSTFGLVGESGSGKSTLGFAILRLQNSSGQVEFDSNDISALSGKQLRKLRKRMQIVFQDPFSSLSPRRTIFQIIAEGLRIHYPDLHASEVETAVVEALEDVGLSSEIMHRYPHEFSGGQRQRIAIARVIILKPEFLVLDEPTSALDMTIQAQIIDLLKELQKKFNITYLFITHDLRVIKAMANFLAVMKGGEIVETGVAHEIFSNPQHSYTKSLFKAAFLE